MAKVLLGLGSNVGDRLLYLQKAIEKISEMECTILKNSSSIYETEPYGKKDQPYFLNMVVEIESELSPLEILGKTKQIEKQLGRRKSIKWGPREIDIDILYYDSLSFENDEIIIPHPEVMKRRFVLIPLKEIEPEFKDPKSGLSISEILDKCEINEDVKKLYPPILLKHKGV